MLYGRTGIFNCDDHSSQDLMLKENGSIASGLSDESPATGSVSSVGGGEGSEEEPQGITTAIIAASSYGTND